MVRSIPGFHVSPLTPKISFAHKALVCAGGVIRVACKPCSPATRKTVKVEFVPTPNSYARIAVTAEANGTSPLIFSVTPNALKTHVITAGGVCSTRRGSVTTV